MTFQVSVADREMCPSEPPSGKDWSTQVYGIWLVDGSQLFTPLGLSLVSSHDVLHGAAPDNDCTVVPGLSHFFLIRDPFMDNLCARTCWSKRGFPQSPSLTSHFRGVRPTSDLKSLAVRARLVSSLSFIDVTTRNLLLFSLLLGICFPEGRTMLKVNTTYERAGEQNPHIFTSYSNPRVYN